MSLNDLILKADSSRARSPLGARDVLRVFKAISRHRTQPALEDAAAAR